MTRTALALASLMLAAAPTLARAEVDLDLRRDVRGEARPERVERLAVAMATGEAVSPFSLSLDLAGALSSNAGAAADDEISAAYAGPLATLRYVSPNVLAGWSFSAAAQAGADFYTRLGDDLDEGALVGSASLARPFADGSFSLTYLARTSYDGSFDQRYQTTMDYGARYVRGFGEGGRSSLDLRAFYRAADVDSARRTVLRLDLGHRFAAQTFGATWEIGQRLQYSDHRQDGRDNDLLAATSFGPTWSVGPATVSLAVSYAHNFSDNDLAQVDIFEFGPVVSFSTAP